LALIDRNTSKGEKRMLKEPEQRTTTNARTCKRGEGSFDPWKRTEAENGMRQISTIKQDGETTRESFGQTMALFL